MSWAVLNTEDVLSEFTLQEAAALRTLQGSGSGSGLPFTNIDTIVAHVIDAVRGFIIAGGYAVDPAFDNTLPLGLFQDAIAIARWRVLIATPLLKQLQTEDRRQACEDALKKLGLIAEQKFAPEPIPGDTTARGGNWNSENKLIMRNHPIPRPGAQFTPQLNAYANPTPPAPADTELSPTPVTPLPPGVVYAYYITSLRFAGSTSLESFSTINYGLGTLVLTRIAPGVQGWLIATGPADPDDPDGQVAPLDYNADFNDKHFEKSIGL